MRALAACRCILITRRHCTSLATVYIQSSRKELVEEGKISIHYVKSEDKLRT